MITEEIEMLYNQQLAEYQEIRDLESKLAKARGRHLDLCTQIQQKLAATQAQAGLTLTALTDKGREALPKLAKALAPWV